MKKEQLIGPFPWMNPRMETQFLGRLRYMGIATPRWRTKNTRPMIQRSQILLWQLTSRRFSDSVNRELGEVQYLVLDEADQMLAVGFDEAVESILENLPQKRQSMLFSATMPTWVGDQDEKLAEGIKLYAISATSKSKRTILSELMTTRTTQWGAGQRTRSERLARPPHQHTSPNEEVSSIDTAPIQLTDRPEQPSARFHTLPSADTCIKPSVTNSNVLDFGNLIRMSLVFSRIHKVLPLNGWAKTPHIEEDIAGVLRLANGSHNLFQQQLLETRAIISTGRQTQQRTRKLRIIISTKDPYFQRKWIRLSVSHRR
ncbi:hypothetical protein Bca52824_001322 [Brassica carinata]|uniref:Helicase ATP-binding domain-containing protein n=1 Tax=Brassica carinata TaxID=52824 RepID=A0A8X8BCZ3_BRACI|nr:hypothetical protein Bca52824_001322 [Brassica carinata]